MNNGPRLHLNGLQKAWLNELGLNELWGRPLHQPGAAAKDSAAHTAPMQEEAAPRSGLGDRVPPLRSETPSAQSSDAAVSARRAHSPTGETPQTPPQSSVGRGVSANTSNVGIQLPEPDPAYHKVLAWLQDHPEGSADQTELQQLLRRCQACSLHRHRDQVVLGNAADRPMASARFFFVTDAPSREEDRSGEAMVGEVGKLFLNILKALGIDQEAVFAAPLVKCHPFASALQEEHAEACSAVLRWQIRAVQPEYIIAFGEARRYLPSAETQLDSAAGGAHSYLDPDTGFSCPLLATHDLRYALANPMLKAQIWGDLKILATGPRHKRGA